MQTGIVQAGSNQWSVNVAQTTQEITTGLSQYAFMPTGTGMLFDLGGAKTVTVNMAGMQFPISVLFLDTNLVVIGVVPIFAPDETPITMNACRMFLEVNAGDASSVSVGDQVTLVGYTPIVPPAPPASIDINAIINIMMVIMIIKVMSSSMVDKGIKKGGEYLDTAGRTIGKGINKGSQYAESAGEYIGKGIKKSGEYAESAGKYIGKKAKKILY